MSFTVPNLSDSAHPELSRLFSTDLDILGRSVGGAYGVSSGCEVTQSDPLSTFVTIEAGACVFDFELVPTTELQIDTASEGGLPFIRLISALDNGDIRATSGAQSATPLPPPVPAGRVALAYVLCLAETTELTDDEIVDKRIFVPTPNNTLVDWTRLFLDESQTITSSTTLQSTQLSVTMAANTIYQIRALLMLGSKAASDYKFGWTGPASPTSVIGHWSRFPETAPTNPLGNPVDGPITAYNTTGVSPGDVGTDGNIFINFDFRIANGSNAGTFSITAAQRVSVGSPSGLVIHTGSYIESRIIAN